MPSAELRAALRQAVQQVRLVDTHEHIMPESERLAQPIDFFYLFPHYASSDLVSSGMSFQELDQIRDIKRDPEERWRLFAPYWERMRTTAYGRALLIAVRDLFDADDINAHTWPTLSAKVAASNRPGWYQHVLKDKADIDVSIIDVGATNVDPHFFSPAIRFDQFIIEAGDRRVLDTLGREYGVNIHSLGDLERALDVAFERAWAGGMVAVKTGLAYLRILRYDKVPRHEAETVFNRVTSHVDEARGAGRFGLELSWGETKPLQDYMMHQVIRRAIGYGLPIQVHTGLQEGNANLITNSNPTHLANLFLEYKEARFDLFHGSYPYMGELTALAKNFQNVFVDMCWMWIISPSASRRWLHEWLETVPANKIFGFGGDYRMVEGAYAHARMARDGVAQVLAEKVEEGYLSEDEALRLAPLLLRENALALFDVAGARARALQGTV